MDVIYTSFKALHVIAVIVWLGGLVGTAVLNARIATEGDPRAMAATARASRFFGSRIVGPAAGLTLIAGLVMVAAGGLQLTSLWILWGIGGLLVSMALGATVIRRTGDDLRARTAAGDADAAVIGVLQRRLRGLSVVNLLVLFSAVAAMVFKPTL